MTISPASGSTQTYAPSQQSAPTTAPAAPPQSAEPGATVEFSPAAIRSITSGNLSQAWQETLTSPAVFDTKYYAEHNPDLGKAGLSTPEQLKQHWLTFGIHELRQANEQFNSVDYLALNPDLLKAGLHSQEAALDHYLTFGVHENRRTVSDIHNRPEIYSDPKVFNPTYYADLNPDLAKNGVTTPEQLKAHWLTLGIHEGRQGSAGFDANWYLDHYPDLRKNGVNTDAEAIQHYHDFGQAEGRQTSALTADIPFGSKSDLKLDVYQPAQPGSGKIPVAINLVGGGWQSANKDWSLVQKAGKELSDKGVAVVSPQYHVAPQDHYPTQMSDVDDVLKYVKDHAAENNWDLDNITLMGGSAGAHLALQHTMNPKYDNNPDLPKVKNVIALAPPTDLSVDLTNNSELHRVVSEFLGSEDTAVKQEASPLTYAGIHSDKRFYVAYADNDPIVNAQQQTQPLIDKMQAAGQNLTVNKIPNGGHGNWSVPNDPLYQADFNQRLADWILAG